MIHLLDTNTCIRHLNQRATPISQRLKTMQPQEVALCSVVKAELYHGARKSQHSARTLAKLQSFLAQFQSFYFDDEAAEQYGIIKPALEKIGMPIGPNDLLIASIALANNLTLVTHNTKEFSRINGLLLNDWEATP